MQTDNLISVSCCFTGHRPAKLPWGNNEHDPRCLLLQAQLLDKVQSLYRDGFRHYICGMALGADMLFCEAVLQTMKLHDDITLEAAIPCSEQADRWSAVQRMRYETLLKQCSFQTLISEHYAPGCMLRRNRYMVSHASHLIAVYDGIPSGGTYYTIQHAMQQGLQIDILTPQVKTVGQA